jgi:hypothetical protein
VALSPAKPPHPLPVREPVLHGRLGAQVAGTVRPGGLRLRADAQAEGDHEVVMGTLPGVERGVSALGDASAGRPRATGCSRGCSSSVCRERVPAKWSSATRCLPSTTPRTCWAIEMSCSTFWNESVAVSHDDASLVAAAGLIDAALAELCPHELPAHVHVTADSGEHLVTCTQCGVSWYTEESRART